MIALTAAVVVALYGAYLAVGLPEGHRWHGGVPEFVPAAE
jgi:hypothetical protein